MGKRQGRYTPSEGTHLFVLENEGIVLSQSTQQLFALDTAATVIWCYLKDGLTPAETKAALAQRLELPEQDASNFVRDSLDQWLGLGLLGGKTDTSFSQEASNPLIEVSVDKAPPFERPISSSEHSYLLLDSRFIVRYTSLNQEKWVCPVLAHWEVGRTDEPDLTVDIIKYKNAYYIYGNGKALRQYKTIKSIAPGVKSILCQAAFSDSSSFLSIHAGVIGTRAECLLLPGPSGSGKTVLTAALMHAGFQYYSDEIALLEEPDLRVRPVPLSLCVKSSGWQLLTSYFPDLADLPIHLRADGRRVRYLPPMTSAIPVDHHTAKIGCIVFPRFNPNDSASLRPTTKSLVLQRLFQDSLAVPADLNLGYVAKLIAWIEDVDCYDLTAPNIEEAVGILSDLLPKRSGRV